MTSRPWNYEAHSDDATVQQPPSSHNDAIDWVVCCVSSFFFPSPSTPRFVLTSGAQACASLGARPVPEERLPRRPEHGAEISEKFVGAFRALFPTSQLNITTIVYQNLVNNSSNCQHLSQESIVKRAKKLIQN